MDAVLFGNGIGNFVMATPFLQQINPDIFIPEDDYRREAIESISLWPVKPFKDVSQFEPYDKVYRLWASPKVKCDNMIYQHHVPLRDWPKGLHESEVYFKLIKQLKKGKPKIKVEGGWKLYRAKRQKIIALGNGSTLIWDKKRWPDDNWVELAGLMLADDPELQMVFLGSENEKGTGKKLTAKFANKVWNFAGLLSLSASVDVLSQCDMFITTDSGLMHCAGAVNTPIIALWQCTSYDKNKPLSDAKVVRIQSKTGGCVEYPCHGKPCMWDCTDAVCMKTIKPKQVMEVLRNETD